MHRAQIVRQIRTFKKRRFPHSETKAIHDAIHAGSLDFAEYTQWEKAFLEDRVGAKEISEMAKWLRATDNYVVFSYLRKIAPTDPIQRRDWMYAQRFYAMMIDLTKAMLKYSVERIRNSA